MGVSSTSQHPADFDSSPNNAEIVEGLELTETLHVILTTIIPAETLTFAEQLTQVHEISESLSFSESVVGIIGIRETLVFVETLVPQVTYNRTLPTDTISFAEHAGHTVETTITTETITFAESLKVVHDARDTITFNETLVGFRVYTTSDVLTFTESLTPYISVTNRVAESLNFSESLTGYSSSIRDTLDFIEQLHVIVERSISESLTFTESLKHVQETSISETLVFLETLIGLKSRPVSEVIAFIETLAPQLTLTKNLSEVLTFSEMLIPIQYRTIPGIQAYSGLGTRQHITLTFPYVSPSLTLDIRNPKFGNTSSLETNVIVRRTVGGQLLSGRKSYWSKFETLKMSFEGLRRSDVMDLISFFKTSYGLEIGLLDHENRQWQGVVTSPELEFSQAGRGNQFTTGFEFKGVLA